MKTPEEMAEEYCNTKQLSYVERLVITKGFIAGYKAAQPHWISVKDRLPDIYQRVLILIRGRVFISSIEEEYGDEYRDGVITFWDGDWDWPEVTHWMPLSAPPKEEK